MCFWKIFFYFVKSSLGKYLTIFMDASVLHFLKLHNHTHIHTEDNQGASKKSDHFCFESYQINK